MIDQSLSTADPFGGGDTRKRKSEGVADAINRLLQELKPWLIDFARLLLRRP